MFNDDDDNKWNDDDYFNEKLGIFGSWAIGLLATGFMLGSIVTYFVVS